MSTPLTTLDGRVLRYDELIPCTTAFIDARTPGSDKKENFCLIGSGVAENPGQVVHIKLPHPFDIGAAKQPRGCKNSHHSHDTSEVFVVHKGSWKFSWGHDGSDGEAVLTSGDTISIPTNVFRGFENVGDDEGFLYCMLGLDQQQSAGHVTWSPYVYKNAKQHGLVLMKDGRLIDTVAGEEIPSDGEVEEGLNESEIAKFDVLSIEDMLKCVILNDDLEKQPKGGLTRSGVSEYALVGPESESEALSAAKMGWNHGGFSARRLVIESMQSVASHVRSEHEVVFVHQGNVTVTAGSDTVTLNEGDLVTIPEGAERSFVAGDAGCDLIITRGSDAPSAAQFL